MTRTEAANWISLLEAHAEGKIIQIMDGVGKWKDLLEGPAFNYLPSHYRIKLEPRSMYAAQDSSGQLISTPMSKDEMEAWLEGRRRALMKTDFTIVEFREVLE